MRYRIIFVGTDNLGEQTLETFIKDPRFEVTSVITGLDKGASRGLSLKKSGIKKIAEMNNLVIHQAPNIVELKQKIIQENPDILLVIAFGEIIPESILKIASYGAINVHPSLLPKYRGASPMEETLLQGEKETGVSWIRMIKKMDAGPLIEQKKYTIKDGENYPSLAHALGNLAAQATPDVLLHYIREKREIEQDEAEASYCHKIKKTDGSLDFKNESADVIDRKIRAYYEWPGAYFSLNGKRIKVFEAQVGEQKISPGEITILPNKNLGIGTTTTILEIIEIQPESKRSMESKKFLRGIRNLPKEI